ncbi:hypothetical protein UFOVP1169_36 [uncultured Caudovirales phage]|uniref:Uncharacterized protein n=1 Tax=uncultured Caudovirales phage TaxID=2100421 RepID=A0A6J5R5I2_9CAUD|nr:hypothetical protein UFOVP1169_36 [uncultured Caudovirales phage]
MKFSPKSEAQIAKEQADAMEAALLSKGQYPFEVLEATEGQSKKGNDMITIKVGVMDSHGSMRGIFDYLLEAMQHKLRHFADAVGMLAEYEAGTLNADDLVGLTGECLIDIQPPKDGYSAKNVVKDYVKRNVTGEKPAPAKGAKTETVKDDSIPW